MAKVNQLYSTKKRLTLRFLCSDNFEAVDIERVMNEDFYVSRFFMHNYDEAGDQCEISVEMIISTMKWRKTMGVNGESYILSFGNCLLILLLLALTAEDLKESIKERGNLYVHNKDKDGKKLLVFNVKQHRRGEEPVEDMKKFFLYCLERVDR